MGRVAQCLHVVATLRESRRGCSEITLVVLMTVVVEVVVVIVVMMMLVVW